MLILARIDDRLIHGQVTVGWAKPLNADSIMVADDAGAEDEFRKALIMMAAPADMEVQVLPVKAAADELKDEGSRNRRLILLLSSPSDALRLIREGVLIKRFNIGGLHFAPGKRRYMDALFLDEHDLKAIKELVEAGVKLEYKPLPTDAGVNVAGLIEI
jgi:mannose/fructose/sorbose-specific phosphotransferase system IIB component